MKTNPSFSRGQTALEYLMTYGWALVVIVIVISALYALGILNPETYIKSNCTGGDKILYIDHSVNDARVLAMKLSNGAGANITVTGIEFGADFAGANLASPLGVVAPQGSIDVNATSVTSGVGSYTGTVSISYNRAGGVSHKETLTCSGRIE